MAIHLNRNLYAGAYDKCGMHFQSCGLGDLFTETIDLLTSVPVVAKTPSRSKPKRTSNINVNANIRSTAELRCWRQNRLEIWGNDATVFAACKDKWYKEVEQRSQTRELKKNRLKASKKCRSGGMVGCVTLTPHTKRHRSRHKQRQKPKQKPKPKPKLNRGVIRSRLASSGESRSSKSILGHCNDSNARTSSSLKTKRSGRRVSKKNDSSRMGGLHMGGKDRPTIPLQASEATTICSRKKNMNKNKNKSKSKFCNQHLRGRAEVSIESFTVGDHHGNDSVARATKRAHNIPPLRLSKVEKQREKASGFPPAPAEDVLVQNQRRGSISWRERSSGPRISGRLSTHSPTETTRSYDGERTRTKRVQLPLFPSTLAKAPNRQFSDDIFGKSFCLDRSGWGDLSEAASCTTAARSVRLEEELSEGSGTSGFIDMIDREMDTSHQEEEQHLAPPAFTKSDTHELGLGSKGGDVEPLDFAVDVSSSNGLGESRRSSGDERCGLLEEIDLTEEGQADSNSIDDDGQLQDEDGGSFASGDPFELSISEMDI